MKDIATKKIEAEVKLYLVKKKVCFLCSSTSPFSAFVTQISGEDDPEVDSENEEANPRSKKKKVRSCMRLNFDIYDTRPSQNVPSQEEELQAGLIQELERRHRCEDRRCGTTPCYVNGPDAEHIHLTHMHLRTWAAVIVVSNSFMLAISYFPDDLFLQQGGVDGVDKETPPNTKIFDPTNKQNTDDVSLLAKRRLAHARDNVPQPITVNFPGFAQLFAAAAPNAPTAPTAPAAPPPVPRRVVLLPPMELGAFCTQYFLSQNIQQKLEAIQVTGPHVLRLISDADL